MLRSTATFSGLVAGISIVVLLVAGRATRSPSAPLSAETSEAAKVSPPVVPLRPSGDEVHVNLSGQGTGYPAIVPERLRIPSIGVDAPLVALGRQPDGTLQVPSDTFSAGWYDQGPSPGEPGPAVIVGHVDSLRGPAVFYRLPELTVGNVILVDEPGVTRRFTVTGEETFPKTDFPTSAVYGPAPVPELRLITCGGPFDRAVGHYEDNIIVFALAS